MIERTLMIIKPEGFEKKNKILEMAQDIGRIVYDKIYNPIPLDKLAKHYLEHKGTKLYDWLLSYYIGKPIEILVLEGDNAIINLVDLVGHSDPAIAKEGTIRRLSEDSLMQANLEHRPIKNLVHCPKNKEEAKRELNIWREQNGHKYIF